eukprot:363318-Chlamydomonas_euryale.AAC.7
MDYAVCNHDGSLVDTTVGISGAASLSGRPECGPPSGRPTALPVLPFLGTRFGDLTFSSQGSQHPFVGKFVGNAQGACEITRQQGDPGTQLRQPIAWINPCGFAG